MPFKSLVSAISGRSSKKEKSPAPVIAVTQTEDEGQPAADPVRPSISRGNSYQSTYTRRTATRPSPSPRRQTDTSDTPRVRKATPPARPRPLRIQVPLYIYPTPDAWEPLFTALAAHPKLIFDIIINPFNGPGPDPLPDTNYRTQLSRLSRFSNAIVYGYVNVRWAERSLEDVLTDVESYEHWNAFSSTSSDLKMHIDGIFVDEAPWHVRSRDYMVSIYRGVKDTLTGSALVWINPGCPIARDYYNFADRVTAFESGHKEWVERKGIAQGFDGGAAERKKSTVMVHSCPREKVSEVLQLCREEQLDGVFLTDTSGYVSWGLGWAEWIKIVADEVDATT